MLCKWSIAGLFTLGLILLASEAQTQDECNPENMMMGRYFHPHPTICTQYLQCTQLAEGGWYGKPRNCAPGLFWDVYSTSCRTPNELRRPCANDPCRAGMAKREAENHCRSFFVCSRMRLTDEMLCCDRGDRYDPVSQTCVLDITRECINDVCTEGPPLNPNITCRLKPFRTDPRFYYEKVVTTGASRVIRNCPPGTNYNEGQCGCTDVVPLTFLRGCSPSFMLNFAEGIISDLQHGHTIKRVQVGVNRQLSIGIFSGFPGRLIIPRYANQDWRDSFVFRVIFATQQIPLDNAVILSNSGCSDEEPSIKLSVRNNNIVEGMIVLEDGTPVFVALPFSTMGLNEAIFVYDGASLELTINKPDSSQLRQTVNVPAFATNIALRKCAFQIGYGTGANFFRGFIDQVEILVCP